MTEKDAVDKWCPYSFNREEILPCAASKCACWEWNYRVDPSTGERLFIDGRCGLANK